MKLRAAALKDETFLWEAQCHAALLDLKDAPMIAVQSNPILARAMSKNGGELAMWG